MINAVLFDLFETLVTESGVPVPRASACSQTLGLNEEKFRTEWKLQQPRVVLGELLFQTAPVEIGRRSGTTVDSTVLQRVCDKRVRAKTKVFRSIHPQLVALTGLLRRQGVRLAVVSNCFAEDVLTWPKSALASDFACTVFSFEVGTAKPDRYCRN